MTRLYSDYTLNGNMLEFFYFLKETSKMADFNIL